MSQLKNAAFPQLVVKGSNSRGLTTAPPGQMRTDSLILEDQLVGLVRSKLSLCHCFAAPAYGQLDTFPVAM